MTTKLFYQDAYKQSFTTEVSQQQKDEAGNWYVILQETAFYPTGGGQPFDKGTLNDQTVLNVEEIEGEIRHYVEQPLENQNIEGVIDWDRRFDHMQQHAGQHILSAAFSELFGYETISFHLGKEKLTIDLEIEQLSEEEIQRAETLANQIISENHPIETKWVTSEKICQYPLRKQPTVTEGIRLVIISNFDYNGCGGIHPDSTGAVFAIKILDYERQKKKVRVRFICGNRVLVQFQQKNKVIKEVSNLISAPEEDVSMTIKRILERNAELERALEQTSDKLLQFEARDMLVHRLDNNVSRVYENRTIQELQKIARYIVREAGEVFVFLVTENAGSIQMVFSRGESANINMKHLMAEVLPLINGKGGGSESMAQGGGEQILTGADILSIVLKKMNSIE